MMRLNVLVIHLSSWHVTVAPSVVRCRSEVMLPSLAVVAQFRRAKPTYADGAQQANPAWHWANTLSASLAK